MRVLGEVLVRRPFPWTALLDYLALRVIAPFERIEAAAYVRELGRVQVRVHFEPRPARLVVAASGRVARADTLARVARLFDAGLDPRPALALLAPFAQLAPALAAAPGMRPLGAWSPFELCVRTLVGQQVSVAAANTLMRRLVARCGVLEPARLAIADLTQMGMPGKRVEAIRGFAAAAAQLPLDGGDWALLEPRLAALPGFGPWTRAYLALRLGRDADAFPHTDLGLIRAAGAPSAAALLATAERWRPWRGHAAVYLWAWSASAAR